MNTITRIIAAVALLAATAIPAHSQHYLGVRAGWGLATARIEPPEYTEWITGAWSGGIAWKYLSESALKIDNFKFHLGAMSSELEYMQRGYQYRLERNGDIVYRRTINSITLPLIWQPYFYFPKNWRLIISAGVSVQYNISSRVDSISLTNGLLYSAHYEELFVRDNPFTYGLVAGLGINYIIGQMELLLEARYHFGYGDILRNTTIYPTNPRRSPLDNINISLGIFFRISNRKL